MSSFIDQVYNAAYEDALVNIKQAHTLMRAFSKSPQGAAATGIVRKLSKPARSFLDIGTPRVNQAMSQYIGNPNMMPQQLMNSPVSGSALFTPSGKPISAHKFGPGAVTPQGIQQGAFDVFSNHMGQYEGFKPLVNNVSAWQDAGTQAVDAKSKLLDLFKQFMAERKAMQGQFGQ